MVSILLVPWEILNYIWDKTLSVSVFTMRIKGKQGSYVKVTRQALEWVKLPL